MSQEEHLAILNKVKPILKEIWDIQKRAGFFIETFGHGMVYGYLLGKGLSHEEVNVGTSMYASMINKIVQDSPNLVKKSTSILFDEKGQISGVVE